ncbi:hypothetical protein M3M38_00030 [Fructilactobacillus cliffordii]|uniref:hypothetical protein n=1 Tax=Fructilactobacillus cliffordii TaxID=2940299 RepID=UPI002092F353|nr:hypothetical protein [Fructilactobacillus cliffordii]USS86504.1 hypothetical protein M3M38_00030 [Fructilactobacillus cliffordii]
MDLKALGEQINQLIALIERYKALADTTQHRLDEVVSGKTDDAEVKDARVNVHGDVYTTLSERLNVAELKRINVSNVIGYEDSIVAPDLWIEDLDDPGTEFTLEDVGHANDDSMPIGADTIRAVDIITEPAELKQGGSN